jgi:hypothetical protein
MSQHRNTEFVTASITPAARDALKRLTLILSAERGERMSMSDTIIYAERQLTSATRKVKK